MPNTVVSIENVSKKYQLGAIGASSLNEELARRWAPSIMSGFSKQGEHKAMADIRESIRELAYYRQQLFASAWHRP